MRLRTLFCRSSFAELLCTSCYYFIKSCFARSSPIELSKEWEKLGIGCECFVLVKIHPFRALHVCAHQVKLEFII
jgi:hypothetical protein